VSQFLETSNVFVKNLLDLDNQMKAKISSGFKSVDDINQMYLERLSLYEKSYILPLNENDKLFLQYKKDDVYLELKLFKCKQGYEKPVRRYTE
jgi:hypothetical protein